MIQHTSYPYCIHGVYVGGCGADYLCGACEGDELEPTAYEQRGYIHHLTEQAAQRNLELLTLLSSLSVISIGVIAIHREDLCARTRKIASELSYLREIEKWSEHEDDVDWIYNRHAARSHDWDQASGEDQFWSLPECVLDGP